MSLKLRLKIFAVNSIFYDFYIFFKDLILWYKRNYSGHSPTFIKRTVLIKNALSNSIWIETGTYLGQTTKFLSKHFCKIYSIEANLALFNSSKKYLKKYKNIEIINATSEIGLKKILSKKINKDVNFFLDAHGVSNNKTKTYIGKESNPVLSELNVIKKKINNLKNFRIFIDDVDWCAIDYVRKHKSFKLSLIINWCRKNNLQWIISNNILIIRTLDTN
jgi:hypothetical protein